MVDPTPKTSGYEQSRKDDDWRGAFVLYISVVFWSKQFTNIALTTQEPESNLEEEKKVIFFH